MQHLPPDQYEARKAEATEHILGRLEVKWPGFRKALRYIEVSQLPGARSQWVCQAEAPAMHDACPPAPSPLLSCLLREGSMSFIVPVACMWLAAGLKQHTL